MLTVTQCSWASKAPAPTQTDEKRNKEQTEDCLSKHMPNFYNNQAADGHYSLNYSAIRAAYLACFRKSNRQNEPIVHKKDSPKTVAYSLIAPYDSQCYRSFGSGYTSWRETLRCVKSKKTGSTSCAIYTDMHPSTGLPGDYPYLHETSVVEHIIKGTAKSVYGSDFSAQLKEFQQRRFTNGANNSFAALAKLYELQNQPK
jgi:hypothetical protein